MAFVHVEDLGSGQAPQFGERADRADAADTGQDLLPDAVLLIVAILDDAKLVRFYELASGAGLSALVEVHDASELQRAQAINAPLIGVNNRNLKNFAVDLGITESLAAQMNLKQTLLVAESGIDSRADVERLAACGAHAVLVGESLMREDNISAKVRALGGRS